MACHCQQEEHTRPGRALSIACNAALLQVAGCRFQGQAKGWAHPANFTLARAWCGARCCCGASLRAADEGSGELSPLPDVPTVTDCCRGIESSLGERCSGPAASGCSLDSVMMCRLSCMQIAILSMM